MFTKFAVWIMVYSSYPPPSNHIYIGDTNSCKKAPIMVERWIDDYFKPKDYYGWVCLRWEEHIRLLYEDNTYLNRVQRDKKNE